MTLSKRHAAASAPPSHKSAPAVSKQRPPVSAAPAIAALAAARMPTAPADDDDDGEAYQYKAHNPKVLLSAFAVSAALCLYCLYAFFTIKWANEATAALRFRVDAVQTTQARQEQLNRNSRAKFDLYAEHRGNVTTNILYALQLAQAAELDVQPHEHTLLLLGAGNLNDVTLSALMRDGDAATSSGFDSLALVDLDSAAMREGLNRQVDHRGLSGEATSRDRVRMYTADVTGSFDRLNEWKRERVRHDAAVTAGTLPKGSHFPNDTLFDAWLASLPTASVPFARPAGLPGTPEAKEGIEEDAIEVDVEGQAEVSEADASAEADSSIQAVGESRAVSARPPQYSVVASVCLLSQLLDMYMTVVGDKHPRYLEGVLALREAHLALMLDLLPPGGVGLLISDVVASTTVPALRTTPHAQLGSLLPDLVKAGNFFTGCNPRAIEASLTSSAGGRQGRFARQVQAGSVRLLQPWSWRMGGEGDKRFLVYAIVFQKAAK